MRRLPHSVCDPHRQPLTSPSQLPRREPRPPSKPKGPPRPLGSLGRGLKPPRARRVISGAGSASSEFSHAPSSEPAFRGVSGKVRGCSVPRKPPPLARACASEGVNQESGRVSPMVQLDIVAGLVVRAWRGEQRAIERAARRRVGREGGAQLLFAAPFGFSFCSRSSHLEATRQHMNSHAS